MAKIEYFLVSMTGCMLACWLAKQDLHLGFEMFLGTQTPIFLMNSF